MASTELGGLRDVAEDVARWLREHPTVTFTEALAHLERDVEMIADDRPSNLLGVGYGDEPMSE